MASNGDDCARRVEMMQYGIGSGDRPSEFLSVKINLA